MSCKTVLPTNIDEAINLLDIAGCEKFSSLKESIEKIKSFNNALEIDEKHLALLVDEYDAGFFREFTENTRDLVLFAQHNYPRLGTVGAINKAIVALGVNAHIEEWFEYDGEPYGFKIVVDELSNNTFKEKESEEIKRLIDRVKNVRSFLEHIEIKTSYKDNINFSSALAFKATIEKELNVEWKQSANLYFNSGEVFSLDIEKRLNPKFELSNNINMTGAVIWGL